MLSFSIALLCRRWFFPTFFLLGVCASHAGLVLHYTFDETSGTTAYDSSGGGNHGTLTNMTGTEWTSGKIGGALSFDGLNDHVEAIGYKGITGTVARTQTLWFKSTNAWGAGTLFHYGALGGAYGGTSNKVFLFAGAPGAGYSMGGPDGINYVGGNLADGAWHHIALTMPENATEGVCSPICRRDRIQRQRNQPHQYECPFHP